MTEKLQENRKGFSADWFMQGALTRIGDAFDRLTGRKWVPSSSLATSELIERMKALLDSEGKEIPGKGVVVPHNIKLKMQWDKFSTDADESIAKLETELLTAAADHINDSLYYTYAPLKLEVKPDYFTEGVKLFVGFDKFADEENEAELNLTVPSIGIKTELPPRPETSDWGKVYIARFEINGSRKDRRLQFPIGGRLSVGRTGGNDLVIDDSSVSKIHASLMVNSDSCLSVADTGSTNGTFVNDERIAYGMATRLAEGDRVKFGVVDIFFEHIPKPADIEDESISFAFAHEETVEEGGFEFSSRLSEDSRASVVSLEITDSTIEIAPDIEQKEEST